MKPREMGALLIILLASSFAEAALVCLRVERREVVLGASPFGLAGAGNTNVWTLMSCDPELGYVYLPFGTPTNDFYGGHRPGNNLFAEALVALEARSGKRVWHYQIVHHGLWDYDLPAAPNLVDFSIDGREIAAVAQITKQGFIFVFDRRTGEPLWPIEERPVPQSRVPGEKSSPTQPFPTRPRRSTARA